jgi:copper oxidase (laccase) domain-containing protein
VFFVIILACSGSRREIGLYDQMQKLWAGVSIAKCTQKCYNSTIMATEVISGAQHLIYDADSVWLQVNRTFGNTVPELSDDGLENRDRAVRRIREFTAATHLIRIKPLGTSGFVDLGVRTPVEEKVVTDGLITTNPDHILHANPADCGQIAVTGYSGTVEKSVLGLFHASRRIVDEGGHITPLEYMRDAYGIETQDMTVRLSPSIRKESYIFSNIDASQRSDPKWEGYIHETDQGEWSVDFHQRTIDDLIQLGVETDNLFVSPHDTGADSIHFSKYRQERGMQERGGNGLFVALR